MHADRQVLARRVGMFGAGLGIAALAKLTLAGRRRAAETSGLSLRTSVTIRRDPGEIYRYWRKLSNLPRFMRHLDVVTENDGHSRWRARGPIGMQVEWEAEMVADRQDERIAWRSLEGATIPNRGSVEFRQAPRGRGTEVHLELSFEPPGGPLGAAVARLIGQIPEQQLKDDLRRLKQILETGEIVHSDASIHHGLHPARPPKPAELPLVQDMVRK